MTDEYRMTLNDVSVIINGLDSKTLNKLPKKLRKFIEDNKIKGYTSNVRTDIPLENQELNPKTKAFLAMIYLNYWCETEQAKNEYARKLCENELKHQNSLKEKYNVENVFKKNETHVNRSNENNEEVQITAQQDSIFKKIINKIRSVFKKE